MKKLIFTLAMGLCMAVTAAGTQRSVTFTDSTDGQVKVSVVVDTLRNDSAVVDTLSITTYISRAEADRMAEERIKEQISCFTSELADNLVPIIAITFFFISPVLILLVIFSFRFKNRKEKIPTGGAGY